MAARAASHGSSLRQTGTAAGETRWQEDGSRRLGRGVSAPGGTAGSGVRGWHPQSTVSPGSCTAVVDLPWAVMLGWAWH